MSADPRRRRWIALTICAALLAVTGLAGLIAFLVPKTLEDADRWASVGALLLAYVVGVSGVVGWMLRQTYQPRPVAPAAGDKQLGDPVGAAGGGPVDVPGQLLHDVADFTGRVEQIGQLRSLLDPATRRGSGTVVISALAGKGGVGKTALATHVAHLLREEFPDGQLYVNLRGAEAAEHVRRPSDVLAEFLRALKVDASLVPHDEDERAARYRSRLAGQRVIVMLDNAANEAQVRPLLPGSPSAAVIVTSRARLSGLEGATLLSLDVMTEQEGIDLLTNITGSGRVEEEPAEAQAIVRLCGGLPLAIRICGAILAMRPTWPLRQLRTRLDDETRLLRTLRVGDLDVRASFNLSYQNMITETERRAFRLLGLIGARDFGAWIIGPLLGVGAAQAEHIADRLDTTHLLEPVADASAASIRYRFHDLLRVVAQDHLREEVLPQQRSAVERLAGVYLHLVTHARELYEPSGPGTPSTEADHAYLDNSEHAAVGADPVGWFTTEVANLVDLVHLTARFNLHHQTWRVCEQLIPLLEVSSLWSEWAQVNEQGLAAALRSPDNGIAAANMLKLRAELNRYTGDLEAAQRDLRESIAVYRHANDRRGAAAAMIRLGEMLRYTGDSDGALRIMVEAKSLFDACDEALGGAYTLTAIGGVQRVRGQWDEAIAAFQEAIPTLRSSGHRRQAGIALISMGDLYHLKGQWPPAMACFQECGELFNEVGDAMWAANTERHIGIVDTILGRHADARSRFDSALSVFDRIGDERKRGLTLWNLGELLAQQDNLNGAMACFNEALTIFQRLSDRFAIAVVSNAAAWAQVTLGSITEAEDWVNRSIVLSEERGQEVLVATANLGLARLHLRFGRYADAASTAQASLDIYRSLGALRWEPIAQEILTECARIERSTPGSGE
jgi:tetratricopeptide (TPR) repeat protein